MLRVLWTITGAMQFGRDVAQGDASVAEADPLSGLDQAPLADRETLAADDSRHPRHVGDTDGDDHGTERPSKRGHEADGNQQAGNTTSASMPASARRPPDRGEQAQQHAKAYPAEAHRERDPRADDQAGEDVAAHLVGTELVDSAGPGSRLSKSTSSASPATNAGESTASVQAEDVTVQP